MAQSMRSRNSRPLLARYGVSSLIAGVRGTPAQPGRLPGNWVHLGLSTDHAWAHIRQNKHHRWSLDEGQIDQYHLGGALHPHIRWWEAMDVPRRSIQFVEGETAWCWRRSCARTSRKSTRSRT